MATQIEIINSALATLGASTINSLSDTSSNAVIANTKWDIARRALLRMHPWNFAIKRSQLLTPTVTPPYFRYRYQYTLPTDCVRVLRVYQVDDYKVEGRNLLTNSDSVYVKYIYDNISPSSWDALFTELMTTKLSAEFAYAIPGSRTMIDTQEALFSRRLEYAKNVDSQEDIEDEFGQFDSPFISVRK